MTGLSGMTELSGMTGILGSAARHCDGIRRWSARGPDRPCDLDGPALAALAALAVLPGRSDRPDLSDRSWTRRLPPDLQKESEMRQGPPRDGVALDERMSGGVLLS